MSRAPLTGEQLKRLDKVCQEYNFEIKLSPNYSADKNLELLAEQSLSAAEISAKFNTRVSPPTDDCPYYFQLLKEPTLSNLFQWCHELSQNLDKMQSLAILSLLAGILSILLALCVFLPLRQLGYRKDSEHLKPLSIYFTAIGMGFMFIEISQMQRLSIFLGNPSYSLSVVLFSMLVFTALGSMLTSLMDQINFLRSAPSRMLLVCLVIVLVGWATPVISHDFIAAPNGLRIAISVALLAPLGLAAGIAFPTGMMIASRLAPQATPWLWGLNGAASVLSSVIAVIISITFGISFSYYISLLCYAIAALAGLNLIKRPALLSQPTDRY